jgi:DNA transposition AAA+ family ATPase
MDAKKYQFDQIIVDRLTAFRTENALTVAALANKLRTDVTRMSKYLHGTPDVDPRGLEARARDLLRSAARRKSADVPTFQTNVLDEFEDTVEQIRMTNDLGVATGPAGIGKTVAANRYVTDHGSAIMVTVTEMSGTASGVCNLIFRAIDDGSYNYKQSRAEYIIDRLTGMDWPILVDQAQLLKSSGREFLVNLWDATRCPMCMIGNPEILTAFRKNDQHFSRIGIWAQLMLDDAEAAARKTVDGVLGKNQPAELYDMASAVASHPNGGHLRALNKQLMLASDMLASEKFVAAAGRDAVKAFQCAHRKLVRDYTL